MKKHTVTNNVSIFYVKIKQLKVKKRRVWVYLPPDYHCSNKRYPVLYMQDGQNLFDEFTSHDGEWKVDKTLNSLFNNKKTNGVIVVGIDNAGIHRLDEYSPWPNDNKSLGSNKGGKGDDYSNFLVHDLKPQIDKLYRTLPGRLHTGIAGSSLGAYISIYIALKHQKVFSKVGVFSPAFFFAQKKMYQFINKIKVNHSMKIYMDVGTHEGKLKRQYVECANYVFEKLSKNIKLKMRYVIDICNIHHETAWAKRFPEAFLWLYKS